MSGFPIAVAESYAITDFQNLIANLKYNPFINLLANGNMERTTYSDSQVDYWLESGAVNVQSSTQKKFGAYALKIIAANVTDYSYQDLVNYGDYKGLSVTLGCWVYAPATGCILRISDGVSSADSPANITTNAWEFLQVTLAISSSATRIRAELRPTAATGSYYFDGAVMSCGTEVPQTALPVAEIGLLARRFCVQATEPTWDARPGDEYYNTTVNQKFMYGVNPEGTLEWRLIG